MTTRAQEPSTKVKQTPVKTKAVITILGKTQEKAERATYTFSNDLKSKIYCCKTGEKFINMLPLLIDLFSNTDYKIIPISTIEAKESQERVLLSELGENGKAYLEDTIIIDENNYDRIFQTINEVISKHDEVIIDITHGFRHLPILTMGAIFTQLLEGHNKIQHILFAKEIKRLEKYEIIDLLEYLKIVDKIIQERKEKERAETELKTHKEMLSYLTHTLQSVISTGNLIVNKHLDTIHEITKKKSFSEDAIRKLNTIQKLSFSFKFLESLLSVFKLYETDKERFINNWNSEKTGTESIAHLFSNIIKYIFNMFLFSDMHWETRSLLIYNCNNERVEHIKENFMTNVLYSDDTQDALDWLANLRDDMKINFSVQGSLPTLQPYGTRFAILFSIFIELIHNAFKHCDGVEPIKIEWFANSENYVFKCKNSYNKDFINPNGSGKGLLFIENFATHLKDFGFTLEEDITHNSYSINVKLDKKIFE